MRLMPHLDGGDGRHRRQGSILIIVLWVALGLVAITLYFAQSMSFEARAADNRCAAMAAEQAVEGAARYVAEVLLEQSTNGAMPEPGSYLCESVPVGESHFWLIGRPADYAVQPDQVIFGLVDEGGKLNLNNVTLEMLERMTNITLQLAANIYDWRDTNGNVSTNGDGPTIYPRLQPPYLCKQAPYETVEELRLVYPMDLGMLVGEDWNRNGALDPNEADTNRNGYVDPGLLEYFTVYSREPNTQPDGSARVNIRQLNATTLNSLLQTNFSAARIGEISARLGLSLAGGGPGGGPGGGNAPGGGGGGGGATQITLASPLAFYLRSGMTLEEFTLVATNITVAEGEEIVGRVNVTTAPVPVLACLPGLDANLAQLLVDYRRQNPDQLGTVAWVAEALGENNSEARDSLAAQDLITTESYQFSADIAALGPHGRGYKRVKYVFDLRSGTPEVVLRQDLTYLGWALGAEVRERRLLAAKSQ